MTLSLITGVTWIVGAWIFGAWFSRGGVRSDSACEFFGLCLIALGWPLFILLKFGLFEPMHLIRKAMERWT